MLRSIRDSVVVITGASSGIGRATALEFAKEGATLLLAARRQAALEDVAAECERLGGRAIAVPTDVTNEEAVKALAQRANDTFGSLDVWVNNAAVTLFARFDDTPSDMYRQVIETNLFGYIYGARAALPFFREQGSGTLINIDSVAGSAAQPYISAYVLTKYAIRGLSESLRMELNLDQASDINVCTVMPASIDTPIFKQAANYTGRAPKPLDPVYPAEQVAQTIVDVARHPRREVVVGNAGRMVAIQHALIPGLYEHMMAQQVHKNHFQDKAANKTTGNLFEPSPEDSSISGGWEHTSESANRTLAMAGVALVLGGVFLAPVAKSMVGSIGGAGKLYRTLKVAQQAAHMMGLSGSKVTTS